MAQAEHTANLDSKEAIAKIKHIAEGETAMFCTFGKYNDHKAHPMIPRPMATLKVDDQGTLWFMSHRESAKNREISVNAVVQIMYAVGVRAEYMNIEGHATITRDKEKIDELWSPIAKTWFHEGKDDPEITVISVKPKRGYYWDTKHSKMVALAGMLIGAVTGKETDDSIEGTLKV